MATWSSGVRDTGIGMNDTEVEAALEPFRQLATARKPGGTGLGLPLTKALVEANQGTLRISSRKDEGTLVEVRVPSRTRPRTLIAQSRHLPVFAEAALLTRLEKGAIRILNAFMQEPCRDPWHPSRTRRSEYQ